MIAQNLYQELLPYGTLIIAVVVAGVTGIFALKGKRVDAGAWITDTLRVDAEAHREELKDILVEFEEFKEKTVKEREENTKQIELLRIAVASLKIREKELIAYVTLVEKEVQILRELLVMQGAATPESSVTLKTLRVLDSETVSFVEQIVKDYPNV
jgi:hypothetical protein